MSILKIARSKSARPTKFLGLPRGAFSFAFSFALALSLSLLFVTAAAAEPSAESATGADVIAEASVSLDTAAAAPFVLAQAGGDAGRSRPLEPRYQPREPEPESWYNGSYVFALSRSVANSTIAPAGQVPLYVLTVPIDIALLPFALIGGLFG